MAELKPCPFCGSPASTQKGYQNSWFVSCDSRKCQAMVMDDTKEQAIRKWNRRYEE